ncbi:MAG: zinc ribbon domain-containing protein, partial [Caldisericota bacterium]|nr:zinc ribbon domain-containing protein [Caldisericota bacterium]
DTGSTTSTPSTTGETAFKFCPYCGTPLQPDYQFCPGCGKPITIQRIIKTPKEEGVRNDKKTRMNYPVNLTQTRGLSEELNLSDYSRRMKMNRNYSKPFNSFKPAFISRGFGSWLVCIFPEKPLLPWAVSRRIISDYYDYGKLLPNSIGRKISSQILTTRSSYPENLNFSYLKGLGKQIAFNPNLGTTFRGGAIDQLGSSLKNLGEGISFKMVVSKASPSNETWVLRSSKIGAQKDIFMGALIGGISSKIGSSFVDQTRSSSSLGGCLSTLGQGITYEIGVKREAGTLPSLTPTSPQTTPTPGAPAQGGITLTPPGQPVPAQPGQGGIALPASGTLQEPQIIWKQYSLNQAFGHNPLITGYLEYPSTWLVNLDSFNRNVTFSEDASGLTSLTLFPGIMGQFSSAQDLAQQMAYLLQQQVSDLSILNQEFKIVPAPGSAIEVTEGKINLQGSYQGTTFRFNLESYVIYTGAYGSAASGMSGMGYVILTQAPQGIFTEKEQKYFNHIILSYKRSLGVVK